MIVASAQKQAERSSSRADDQTGPSQAPSLSRMSAQARTFETSRADPARTLRCPPIALTRQQANAAEPSVEPPSQSPVRST